MYFCIVDLVICTAATKKKYNYMCRDMSFDSDSPSNLVDKLLEASKSNVLNKAYITKNQIHLNALNERLRHRNDDQGLLFTEYPEAELKFITDLVKLGLKPNQAEFNQTIIHADGSFELAEVFLKANDTLDVNKVKFSEDNNSPQQKIMESLDNEEHYTAYAGPAKMLAFLMPYGLNLDKKVWVYSQEKFLPFKEWIFSEAVETHPNWRNIQKIRKQINEFHDVNQEDIRIEFGGRKGSKSKCTSTGKKVTFTKDGKKVTRVVHENQRGTKMVKYNDAWVLLSKLKI